jgi:hypothetical protein
MQGAQPVPALGVKVGGEQPQDLLSLVVIGEGGEHAEPLPGGLCIAAEGGDGQGLQEAEGGAAGGHANNQTAA